jgi:hypothetical protein
MQAEYYWLMLRRFDRDEALSERPPQLAASPCGGGIRGYHLVAVRSLIPIGLVFLLAATTAQERFRAVDISSFESGTGRTKI